MGQLQLVLVNDSNEKGSLVVYQQYGDSVEQTAIAWFAKYVYPSTQISFQWDPSDYDFVWSATGQIQTGVVFQAAQVLPANLVSSNGVTLSYDSEHHIFYFSDQKQTEPGGAFVIRQDQTLPMDAAAVGIGVAGKATVAVQAVPNMIETIEVTEPKYFVAFGPLQEGEYFDPAALAVAPVEVGFPINVNSLTVTLGQDLAWTVKSNVVAKPKAD